uniref:Uncharacterized protein LOC111114793 isoform X1 n=1 Tax=Crassostrea virginica TaxID=6565 RepID=A0A8B8C088_CRAVI|nr:uncharacterized protein LOC111114793 isoform X1 [Crassostrea virginica]
MDRAFIFLLFVSVVLGSNLKKYIPQRCIMVNPKVPCVCKDEYGNFVDLRPLALKNLTARFQDHEPADGDNNHVYSWNPCYPFVEKSLNDTSGCLSVASCRVNKKATEFEDIGIQNGATFGHFDNGNLSLTYKSRDQKRTTVLSLYCDQVQEESTLRAVGDMGGFFWLQLRSKYSCPQNESTIRQYPGSELLFGAAVLANMTEEPHIPTMPTPGSVTVNPKPNPAPNLHYITFLLSGILITSFLILLVLVGRLFWRALRRDPYPRYSLVPDEDILENKIY